LDLARSLNGASVYLAMNSQDKNQLNRAIPAATFDAILGKLDGQPPDKQGFSGCIFCEDEERGNDTVTRLSFCNRETTHPSLRFPLSDADLSNDHHEQFKLGTMLCQCGRLESCSAWLEVHAVTVSLLCRVTCAVTGCNIDVEEHHCSRVITLPGFLQSARPPSSLSRTWRHPRMARSLAFCALDNLCNLCNGFKGWRSIRRIIESVDHRTDQSVPY
jgi:hypothetical protein